MVTKVLATLVWIYRRRAKKHQLKLKLRPDHQLMKARKLKLEMSVGEKPSLKSPYQPAPVQTTVRGCVSGSHPLCRAQVQPIQEPLSDLQQSVPGPLTEPVDGGAVDQRRVLEEPLPVGER